MFLPRRSIYFQFSYPIENMGSLNSHNIHLITVDLRTVVIRLMPATKKKIIKSDWSRIDLLYDSHDHNGKVPLWSCHTRIIFHRYTEMTYLKADIYFTGLIYYMCFIYGYISALFISEMLYPEIECLCSIAHFFDMFTLFYVLFKRQDQSDFHLVFFII